LAPLLKKNLLALLHFILKEVIDFQISIQYRLRGMATLPEYQGQGLSSSLLRTAFPVIKQNQCTLLWCNAREKAMGFYTKVGFTPTGDFFTIPNIGKHILMSIKID